jgi:protein-S-isoprenylcysteine O-methyltransferase Ste14
VSRTPPLPARLALALVASGVDAALLVLARGGPAAFLASAQSVALVVTWTVAALALSALQPVRGQDPVDADRDAPWRMALLGLLPFAIPPLSALADRMGWMPLGFPDAVRWAGVGLVALGIAIRIVAMSRLGSRFAPEAVVQRGHALETSGLYGAIRHPGYLGAWLAALGSVVAFSSTLAMPLLVMFAWLLAQRARKEDALLERHFGEPYRAYRARTGAFLPRLGR